MGRINKATEGVFTAIVGSPSEIPAYNQFVDIGETLNTSKKLKQFTDTYKSIVTENKNTFEKLALLEEIIMQMRSKENMGEIKLSLVREYIYARCIFFRKGKETKDIRVLVGNAEFLAPELSQLVQKKSLSNGDKKKVNESLDRLLQDKKFIDTAKKKLLEAMDEEIKDNLNTYNTLYK